jgi:amino acid transporter
MASTAPGGTADAQSTGLKRNAVGLMGAALLGAVIMGPALGIYSNGGAMIPVLAPGSATSLVFLIALIMTLPTAYSFALLARDVPHAGAAYKWASRFINPGVGIAVGLCTVIYYMALMALLMPLVALSFTSLVGSGSSVVFALAMFGAVVLVLPIIFRGISLNLETAMIIVTIEVILLTIVGVVAWLTLDGATFSLAPLDPSGIPSLSALSTALILGVLTFTGYDAVVTVAEETRAPRKNIPKATLIAAVLTGGYWVVMSFVFSNAQPPEAYVAAIDDGQVAVSFVAEETFGSWAHVLLDVMGLEASIGVLIGSTIAASRLLFALGRDGVLPPALGRTHPRFRVPWNGIGLVLGVGVVTNAVLGILLGFSFDIYLWLGNLVVFFALLMYMAVNASNIAYFTRHKREAFRPLPNLVVPILGIAVSAYFMYKAFFDALWNAGFRMGRSAVIAALVLLAAAIVGGYVLSRSRSDAARSVGEDPDAGLDDVLVAVEPARP